MCKFLNGHFLEEILLFWTCPTTSEAFGGRKPAAFSLLPARRPPIPHPEPPGFRRNRARNAGKRQMELLASATPFRNTLRQGSSGWQKAQKRLCLGGVRALRARGRKPKRIRREQELGTQENHRSRAKPLGEAVALLCRCVSGGAVTVSDAGLGPARGQNRGKGTGNGAEGAGAQRIRREKRAKAFSRQNPAPAPSRRARGKKLSVGRSS